MLALETDRNGRLEYKVGARESQIIRLGKQFAARTFGVVDTVRTTLICEPRDNRLIAMAGSLGGETRLILFGKLWGRWIGDDGRRNPCEDPLELLSKVRGPSKVDIQTGEISIEFYINIFNRGAYSPETQSLFEDGPYRFTLRMTFAARSGEFARGQLIVMNMETGLISRAFDLNDFPLSWPEEIVQADGRRRPNPHHPPSGVPKAPHQREDSSQRAPAQNKTEKIHLRPSAQKQAEEQNGGERPHRAKLRPVRPAEEKFADQNAAQGSAIDRAKLTKSEPTGPARNERSGESSAGPAPSGRTDHLRSEELIRVIRAERNDHRRWHILEPNLMMGRPERTYALIANFAELIGERCALWPPMRLKTAFKDQPGSVLIGIMEHWNVSQSLALAEDNSESEKIMQWLREREMDRLLKLDLDSIPMSVDEARMLLNVDRKADQAGIKRCWRTLLGFMNADHGRQDERAIHRKKDEVAKILQESRNILIRNSVKDKPARPQW